MRPGDIERREKELLVLAKKWMPRLPFAKVDILIIDEMGKNISGAGIDTNVVGRKRGLIQAAKMIFPKVKRIVVRSLTPESHGNAVGLGYVDVCKTSLLSSHDRHATWTNIITSGNLGGMKYPMHFETDREILDIALPSIGLTPPPAGQSAVDQKHAALGGSRVLGGFISRKQNSERIWKSSRHCAICRSMHPAICLRFRRGHSNCNRTIIDFTVSLSNIGPVEWHVVLPKSFQHCSFELVPWFHHSIILLLSAFSLARFKAIGSVSNPMSNDSGEQPIVETAA